MKRENTIEENIEFLINAYKREKETVEEELDKTSDHDKTIEKWVQREMIECYLDELQFILDLNK